MQKENTKQVDYKTISNKQEAESKTIELLKMALAMAPPFLEDSS